MTGLFSLTAAPGMAIGAVHGLGATRAVPGAVLSATQSQAGCAGGSKPAEVAKSPLQIPLCGGRGFSGTGQQHHDVPSGKTGPHQAVLWDEGGANTWEGTIPGPKHQVQLLCFRGPSVMTPLQKS